MVGEQELERKQLERIELKERIRQQRREAQEEDDQLILETQRDDRRARVRAELAQLRKEYDAVWATKAVEMLETALMRKQQWFASPEAQTAIEADFVKLERYFYEPPNPDSREKEAALNDPKNVVAIQIEAKLLQQSMELEEVRLFFIHQARYGWPHFNLGMAVLLRFS